MMSFKNCIRIRIATFWRPAYYFWRSRRCHVSVSRPCLKVVLVEIGWRRRPNILAPETRKMVLAPLLCFFWLVWWCIVLLKGEQFSLKCFLVGRKSGVKIVPMYEFVFTFAPSGRKMKDDFHFLERRKFLSSEHLSRGIKDFFREFC